MIDTLFKFIKLSNFVGWNTSTYDLGTFVHLQEDYQKVCTFTIGLQKVCTFTRGLPKARFV